MARQHYGINPDPVIAINDESSTFVESHPKDTDYDVRSCRVHSSANSYDVSEPYTTAPFEHNLPDIEVQESGQGTVIATSEGGIDVSVSIASIVAILDNDATDRAALVAALLAGNASLQSDLQAAYGGAGQMVVPLHANAAALLTLTNQALAEQFMLNTNRNRYKLDLSDFTEVRMTVAVNAGSASPNNPRLKLKYHTVSSVTLGDYNDIGTSTVECSIATSNSMADSGWIALAAGAIGDVFLAITAEGGDGAIDPNLGAILAHFR